MSLDFSLKLATDTDTAILPKILSEVDELMLNNENSDVFEAEGMTGGISKISDLSQEILYEETGIRVNTAIWCRLDTGNEKIYEKGLKKILSAYMTVLKHTDGDAIIQLNGDDIKLIRKNGLITVNPDSFSDDENALWRLKDVPFENYRIKKMSL